MGADPWMYFVPYEQDVGEALKKLRAREFAAGRYYPAVSGLGLQLPIRADSPPPGAQHASIEEALSASGATGTQSILDILFVSNQRKPFSISPMDEDALNLYFGTTHPTHEMVVGNLSFFEEIDRGEGLLRHCLQKRYGGRDIICWLLV
jgi:hypothetical protein